jgi:BMFP domain-containing protein YqiC
VQDKSPLLLWLYLAVSLKPVLNVRQSKICLVLHPLYCRLISETEIDFRHSGFCNDAVCSGFKRGDPMSNATGKVLDELAKLVTDAAGAAQGVRREVETAMRSQSEKLLNTLDVVQREDFEAMREMAVKTRTENSALTVKIAELEERIAKIEASLAEKPAKKGA